MKLQPYKTLITMAKEAKETMLAPVRVRQMRKQGEMEVAKIEEQILTQTAKVEELTAKYPVPWDQIVNGLDDLALLERKKGQIEEILAQMFPAE